MNRIEPDFRVSGPESPIEAEQGREGEGSCFVQWHGLDCAPVVPIFASLLAAEDEEDILGVFSPPVAEPDPSLKPLICQVKLTVYPGEKLQPGLYTCEIQGYSRQGTMRATGPVLVRVGRRRPLKSSRPILSKPQEARVNELRRAENERPLTVAEREELDRFFHDIEEAEARYLRPASERMRAQTEQIEAQSAVLRDLIVDLLQEETRLLAVLEQRRRTRGPL